MKKSPITFEDLMARFEQIRPKYWVCRYYDGSGGTLIVLGEQVLGQSHHGVRLIPNGLGQAPITIPWHRIESLKCS